MLAQIQPKLLTLDSIVPFGSSCAAAVDMDSNGRVRKPSFREASKKKIQAKAAI
jgi:hypothetical protein